MTSPLYRPEALQARQDDWMGSVRLPATRMARMMAWVAMAAIAALVLVLALGSHVRKLPARGQVVPVGGVLQVLAPASGSVTASFAGEGDSVKAGQPLLQLQSTLAGTAADGRLATRLDAEFKAQLRDIDTELAGIAQERATRRTSLREQADSLQRQVASAQRHVHIRQQQAQAAQALLERIRPLQREQLISALQVQQHESTAMEARAQLELQQQDLLRLQTELARIREQLTLLPGESDARSVQLQRERSRIRQQAARNRIEGDAVVRAPAAGRVSGLLASTGQAVQAGQPLLSLVPADAPLEVELWLPVDAAGMVRAGTAVALRFDAFPYARYGIRRGTVRAVSASPIAADIDIRHLGLASYRERVAAVMQDDTLFAGSVAANIAAFASDARQEDIERAARAAHIHDTLVRMPMGYESLVGDMGSALSGGQKQRVLLARALYRQPEILLLDEATSHLDVDLERAINAAIAELAITRIIIAHRPETIRSADRVVALQDPQTSAAARGTPTA